MNYFAFTGLVNGLVSIICGSVVFVQNPRSYKNRLYALFCLSISVWGFFYFAWHLADNPTTALFLCRALMMGAIFMSVLGYHHVITTLALDTPRRRAVLRYAVYPATFIFVGLNFTPLFIKNVEPRHIFPFWPVPGPFFHPFLALFLWLTGNALYNIFVYFKSARQVARNQIAWITLASAAGLIGGATNFFLWYNVLLAPYPTILISVFVAITSLLFFRLGLLDVRIVLKHISVVFLIYGSLLAISLPLAMPVAVHFLKQSTINPIIVLLVFGFVVGATLSSGPFIYAYLIRNKIWLRGHLTDGLAHELKSPLGVIQTVLDLLESKVGTGKSAKDALDYVQMIRKNADRLERSVEDLLHVAKLRDGEVDIIRDTLDVAELFQELSDAYAPAAEGKGIQLRFDRNDVEEMVADRNKVSLVFSNLLSNAVKFSSKGTVVVSISQPGGEWLGSVSDEGRGIPDDELRRVFEPFYQGQGSVKGSGLGLAIAKGFIEAHGGKIWAESAGKGLGTTISFTIPKAS